MLWQFQMAGLIYGIKSCKATSNLACGPKECLYGYLGFGDCVEACPGDVIQIDKKLNVAVVGPDKCTGCRLCVKECPRNIIKLVQPYANIIFLCNY